MRVVRFAILVAIPCLTAADPPSDGAGQLAGLFTQACVLHGRGPATVRAWAANQHLPLLPDEARAAFMGGAPGAAFDATTTGGKFVLLSADSGACTTLAQQADPGRLAEALEGDLSQAGVEFHAVSEQGDPDEPGLRRREYLIEGGAPPVKIVVGTTARPGEAMLSLVAR